MRALQRALLLALELALELPWSWPCSQPTGCLLAVWLGCVGETQVTWVVTGSDSLSTVSGTKRSIKSGQIGWEIGQFHVCYLTIIVAGVFHFSTTKGNFYTVAHMPAPARSHLRPDRLPTSSLGLQNRDMGSSVLWP